MFPKREELEKAKVYKFVASGSNNKLAMLVGVISSDPEKTLEHYLKHASVVVVEDPKLLPDRDPLKPGIDLYLGERSDKPFYSVLNRMKQSFFEGILTEDTKLRL